MDRHERHGRHRCHHKSAAPPWTQSIDTGDDARVPTTDPEPPAKSGDHGDGGYRPDSQ
jgi:hypothetical protein